MLAARGVESDRCEYQCQRDGKSLFFKFRFRRCSSQNKFCGVGFAQGDSLTITYSFGVLHPVANASA
jgi:hypothetical protein